jgi:hypothetical protein
MKRCIAIENKQSYKLLLQLEPWVTIENRRSFMKTNMFAVIHQYVNARK